MTNESFLKNFFKKSICTFLIFALTSISVINESSIAYAMENLDFSERKNLVLVLADQTMMNSNQAYAGLTTQYSGLSSSNMSQRVKRYANDIRKKFSNTDVTVVNIPSSKDPVEIATYLKNIYFNNYSDFSNYELKGVVLVGNVPLPKLYNQDQAVLSLYPYTDFKDAGFMYNQELNQFEVDAEKFVYEPEIWHGVINFTESQSNYADIATFLDKNHLNYIKHPQFVNSNQASIMLADSLNESKLLIDEIKPLYDIFQSANKYLAQNKVTKEVVKSLNAESVIPEFADILENIDQTSDTMMPTVLKSLKVGASELFKNAVKASSEKAISTGRYPNGAIYSPFLAIEYLDDYAASYLKSLNEFIQGKYADAFKAASVPVNITKGATLTVKAFDRDGGSQVVGSKNFINHGIDESFFDLIDFDLLQDQTEVIVSHEPQIYGRDYRSISSSSECRIYRGGGLKEDVYKTMYNNRGALINVNPEDEGATCYKIPVQTNNYKLRRSSYEKDLDSDNCTIFKGDRLQDEYRGYPVELDFESKLDVRSCFAMNTYEEFFAKKGVISIFGFPINGGNTRLLNRLENSDDDFIGASIDGNFNLTRALEVFLDDYDSQDWHNFSSYFLANPVKDVFIKEDPFGEDSPISALRLDIRKFPTIKFIPSFTLHADPNGNIIEKALISGNLNLPIDHRNYVTYYDYQGEFQKDILPDAFYATSSDQYLEQINSSLGKLRSINLPIENQLDLEQLLSYEFQDQLNTDTSIQDVEFVSVPKLQFLIDYLSLDLNSKYRLMLKNLLDADFPLDIDGFNQDFDFVEINSFTNQDQILFDITSPDFSKKQISQAFEVPIEEELEGFNVQNSGKNLFTYFTEYLPEWFEEQSDRVESVFDTDSYRFVWPEENNTDFKYSSQKPSRLEVRQLPSFIDVNSDDIEFQVVALTENNDISKDYEEILTIEKTSVWEVLNEDLDETKDGIQIKFEDGIAIVSVAPIIAGEVNLDLNSQFFYVPLFEGKFELLVSQQKVNQEVSGNLSTKIVEGVKVEAQDFLSLEEISADNVEPKVFSFKVTDSNDSIVDFLSPEVKSSSKKVSIKKLEDSNGVYNYQISLPKTSGIYDFEVKFNGVDALNHSIKVNPGLPNQLKLSTSEKLLSGLTANDIDVNAIVYDQFNNQTTINSDLEVSFDESKVLLQSNQNPRLLNGQSVIKLRTLPLKTGFFDVLVKSGSLEKKLEFHLALGLTNQDIQGLNSNSLSYLLNSNQSEIYNSRSEAMLLSGKTQAIITNTHSTRQKQRLMSIHPDKSLEIIPDKLLTSNLEINQDKLDLNFFYQDQKFLNIPFEQSQNVRISTSPNDFINQSFVVVQPNTELTNVSFDSKSVSLDNQELISIEDNLNLDSSLTIQSNPEELLKFEVFQAENLIATLHLNSKRGSFLESPFYFSHPVIDKKSENIHSVYNYLNSITFVKPFESESLFINPNNNRLSKGLDNPSRFANSDDKTLLLFTSGQAMGPSLQSYSDFSTILLGDPTLKLNEVLRNQEDFNATLGTKIASLQSTATSMLETQDYILFTDQDGFISIFNKEAGLLQKSHLKLPLKPEQMITISDDPLEVLILFEDHCHLKDTCTYILKEDSSKSLILERFDLPEKIKPSKIYEADLNKDSVSDLMVYDSDFNFSVFHRSENGNLDKKFESFIFPYPAQYFIDENYLFLQSPNNPNAIDGFASLESHPNFSFSKFDLNPNVNPENDQVLDLEISTRLIRSPELQNFNSRIGINAPDMVTNATLIVGNQSYNLESSESGLYNFVTSENISLNLNTDLKFILKVSKDSLTDLPFVDTVTDQFITNSLSENLIDYVSLANINPQKDISNLNINTINNSIGADGNIDIKIPFISGEKILYLQSSPFGYHPVYQNLPKPTVNISEETGLDIMDLANQTEDELNEYAERSRIEQFFTDANQDGTSDFYAEAYATVKKYANKTEKKLKELICGEGCIATPYNDALLVPGSMLSPPVPLFGSACPWGPIPIGFGTPAVPCGFKLYLSPTVTGSFVLAPCLFTQCLKFQVATLPEAVCNKINEGIIGAMNFVADGISDISGGVVSLEDRGAPRKFNPPSFPKIFATWAKNQFFELIKVIDLPDVKVIYPVLNADNQITDVESFFAEFGFYREDEDLSKIDSLNPYPSCPEDVARQNYASVKDKCGNYDNYAAYEAAKNNLFTRFKQHPQKFFEELSKMPIWEFETENLVMNIPWPNEKELAKFLRSLLLSLDKTVQNFLKALLSWGCFDYENVPRNNTFGDFRKEKLTDDFSQIFTTLNDPRNKPSTEMEYEIVWNYKGKTYQEFSGENSFIEAIKKQYATQSNNMDWISFFIDLLLGGQLNDIISFVNQGKDGVPNEKQKACADLSLGMEGLITNFYQSYESALLWRDLPLQIFEIQDFISKFTVQVLDWGDQILTNITGWFAENTKNLSTWTKMFESLIKIYNNFNILLQVFVDFFDKCDDCKTRRGSSFIDIILGLLPNIGDSIPYLELPKLPDITLDISQIKTGLHIKTPIPKFEYYPLALPRFDFEITFPSAPDIDIGLVFGSIKVPVLPPPPDLAAMIDFPDLPKVQIPLLPVIPLAPEIADVGIDLQEKIGAELDLIKQLLRIYCLVQKGLIPVPELTLSKAIQDMTARPLDIVLPIDKQISIKLPELDIDYVKEYQAILESDLTYETDGIYEGLKNFTTNLNLEIQEVMDVYNKKIQEINEILDFKYDALKDYQLEDIDLQVNPATDEQAMLNIKNALDLLSKVTFIDASIKNPSTHTEIQMTDFVPREDFRVEDSIFFNSEQLAQAKSMANQIYNNVNDQSIASISPSKFTQYKNFNNVIKPDTQISKDTLNNFVDMIDNSQKLDQIITDRNQYLAQAGGENSSSTLNAKYPTGVHYVSPSGAFRRLYEYSDQDQAETNFIFADLDFDSDSDILHSIDKEIFVKHFKNSRVNNLGSNDEVDINNDLEKEITVLTPKNPQIEASFETISIFFDNYEDLDNQIIDIYKPGIEKLIPYQRFVITHDQNVESELQEVNQVSTLSGEVNKGDFENMFTKNSKSSTFKINVPLGMYSVVHSSIVNQKLHTFSSPKAVSVDFCSDRVAPTISGNIPKIANPVLFQDIDLDLNNSIDIGSRISTLSVNYKDQPFFLNLENPTFDIPKVESEVLDKITIQAVDLAGNQSKVEINPKLQDLTIVLDKVSDTNILGKIVPEVSEGNVTILKSNQDRLIPIQTNPVKNSNFEFKFADNPNLQITDNKNRPILEVEDNNLLINDPSLEFTVLNAYEDLDLLTILVSKDSQPITKVLLKSDSNLNPQIVESKDSDLESNSQVLIFDENTKDNVTIEIINDPLSEIDQSAIVKQNQKPILAISRFANPVLIDKQYTLELDSKNTDLDVESLDQHWISLRANKDGENLVSFSIKDLQDSLSLDQLKNQDYQDSKDQINNNPKLGVENLDLNADTNFSDIDENTKGFEEINRLARLGIFEGVNIDGENLFLPRNFLLRSEFAKTILKILCIKPRPESYLAPNVFSDILFSSSYDWFYPITKETFFLGIFEGYKGEVNNLGLSPFKPFDTISRIEAVKVIMEALENMDIISLDQIQEKNPWYLDYLEYSQDLSTLLVENQESKSNFLLTPEEAKEPNQPISRQDFAILISRSLDIYNCIEQRSNLGLPLEDLRIEEDKTHIQESIDRISNQDPNLDSEFDEQDSLDSDSSTGLSKEQEDLLSPTDDTSIPDSSIGVMDPICTACPCPFEKKQGLSLQNKDKFFIIYGEYDPINPVIYSTSKVFKINPNLDG